MEIIIHTKVVCFYSFLVPGGCVLFPFTASPYDGHRSVNLSCKLSDWNVWRNETFHSQMHCHSCLHYTGIHFRCSRFSGCNKTIMNFAINF
jgi:hypothetical protein